MKNKHLILALIGLVFAHQTFADIYLCPDANGVNMVSNTKTNSKCRNVTAESESSAVELERGRRKLIGKTAAQLKRIAREPDQIIQSVSASGSVEKWLYKYEAIILVNGVVTEVVAIK